MPIKPVSLVLFLLLWLNVAAAATLSRGPYLQQPGTDQIVIRWRTVEPATSVLRFGTEPGRLDREVRSAVSGTEHELRLTGLEPGTRYYYSIGDDEGEIAAGNDYYFTTSPPIGRDVPTRIWVLGDPGSQSDSGGGPAVRDAYLNWAEGQTPDLLVLLGDNAYSSGLEHQYQRAIFDRFQTVLRNTPLWSVIGNHDGNNGSKRTESADSVYQTGPYYELFSFPRNGESGGVASNTEAYYSFDHGNIHFVMLDSYFARDTREGFRDHMVEWLKSDLRNQNAKWIIAAWHHSPYSKGSHDSDHGGIETYMRQTILPILESHGVDLVLTGHSHAYERSRFLHGHYGRSREALENPEVFVDRGNGRLPGVSFEDGVPPTGAYQKTADGKGTVYVVAGNASSVSSKGSLDHPVMVVNQRRLGSLVIDTEGDALTLFFLDDQAEVRDRFTIVKAGATPPEYGEDGDTGGGNGDPAAVEKTLERRIDSGANDAEERASGSIYLDSSDLELVHDKDDQIVGLRFTRLDLPPGASIITAWIQFEVDEVSTGDANLTINGEAAGYSKKFRDKRYDLSSRAVTDQQVTWSPPAWPVKNAHGNAQRTPELEPIVQEIVNRNDWQAGNAMTFLIRGSGRRVAESFEGEPGAAALLHIEYE